MWDYFIVVKDLITKCSNLCIKCLKVAASIKSVSSCVEVLTGTSERACRFCRHQVFLQDRTQWKSFIAMKTGTYSKLLKPKNKSPVLWLLLSLSSHSYLYILHALFVYHYMLNIVLYVCTRLNQESNYALQLLFKSNHEEKCRAFHQVYGFISWLWVYCVIVLISWFYDSIFD